MSEDSLSEASREHTAQLRDLSAFQAFTASLEQEGSEQDVAKLVASSLPSVWGDSLGAVGLRSVEAGWEFYGHIDGMPLDAEISKNLQGIFTAVDAASNLGATTLFSGRNYPWLYVSASCKPCISFRCEPWMLNWEPCSWVL